VRHAGSRLQTDCRPGSARLPPHTARAPALLRLTLLKVVVAQDQAVTNSRSSCVVFGARNVQDSAAACAFEYSHKPSSQKHLPSFSKRFWVPRQSLHRPQWEFWCIWMQRADSQCRSQQSRQKPAAFKRLGWGRESIAGFGMFRALRPGQTLRAIFGTCQMWHASRRVSIVARAENGTLFA
jgi:hypothetical protein